MLKQSNFLPKGPCIFQNKMDRLIDYREFSAACSSLWETNVIKTCIVKGLCLEFTRKSNRVGLSKVKVMANENLEEVSAEDDELCPVECVREFKTDEEFLKILDKAKKTNSLVIVDFFRTSCGSCKYIEQGFKKLCKGSGDQDGDIIFLKHNVLDEYDEQSEVAERLRIKTVPLFHFYKNRVLLEAFPTRDKERIVAAMSKYSDIQEF